MNKRTKLTIFRCIAIAFLVISLFFSFLLDLSLLDYPQSLQLLFYALCSTGIILIIVLFRKKGKALFLENSLAKNFLFLGLTLLGFLSFRFITDVTAEWGYKAIAGGVIIAVFSAMHKLKLI